MNKIKITTDSSADLTKELYAKYNIDVLPVSILVNDNIIKDGDIPTQEIFNIVDKTGVLPKTSAVNQMEYEEKFEELLKEYDYIIHFSISSNISSMYNNAVNASKKFDGKVKVIDTMSLSTGNALLELYAYELIEQGLSIDEIVEKVEKRVSYVQASFIVERLDYLYKGGRCSSLALLGANILKIRPQIIVKEGKMGSYKKYRGPMPLCVKKYCEDTLAEFNNPDKKNVFITYSSATPEMVNAAKEILVANGFENIYETSAGATVCSHCGEHTIGILYINDNGINV